MLDKNRNIFLFGGAGFLGSTLIQFLNNQGFTNITIFENDNIHKKWRNLIGLKFNNILDKEKIHDFYTQHPDIRFLYRYDGKNPIDKDAIILLFGARSSTNAGENPDTYYHNVTFPKKIIDSFPQNKIIFASTGAIYGNSGDFRESNLAGQPNNFYSFTKNLVDQYINSLNRDNIYSLRFFNIFGERESFKSEDSQSPVYKWLNSSLTNFPSIYLNPELKRDFVYVEDVCKVIFHILNLEQEKGGIYNVGTGVANTWNEVARIVSSLKGTNNWCRLEKEEPDFIKKPSYQRFTQADISLLRDKLGYKEPMTILEEGIKQVWENLKQSK